MIAIVNFLEVPILYLVVIWESLEFLLWFESLLTFLILQSVEEAECRKAYDAAAEIYKSSFDRSKPAEEV